MAFSHNMLSRPITIFCYPTIIPWYSLAYCVSLRVKHALGESGGGWSWLIDTRCSRIFLFYCRWNANGNSQAGHESKHVSCYAHLWHWETHCSWYCVYCLAIRNRCHCHLHFPGFVRFYFKLSSLEAKCWITISIVWLCTGRKSTVYGSIWFGKGNFSQCYTYSSWKSSYL